MRNNQGVSLIEVVISAAVLAVLLLGVISFSFFNSKSNKSNSNSNSFSGVLASLDSMVKTPLCDQLFSGVVFDDSNPSPQVLPSTTVIQAGNFSLGPAAQPSTAPSGFTYGGTGERPLFQMTLIAKGADTTTISGATYNLDTVDLQIALKKVDGSGKALPGAPWEIKDYTLNLWFATGPTGGAPLPYAPGTPGMCTYKRANVLSGPNVNANCVASGSTVIVNWTQALANQATVTPINPNGWAPVAGPLATGVMSQPFTTPSGDYSNLGVQVVVTDALAPSSQTATAVSTPAPTPFLQSYDAPTMATPTLNPSTFYATISSVQFTISTLNIFHDSQGNTFPGGVVSILAAPPYLPNLVNIPSDGPFPVSLNINAANPGQVFPFTVVATNPCGVSVSQTVSLTSTN